MNFDYIIILRYKKYIEVIKQTKNREQKFQYEKGHIPYRKMDDINPCTIVERNQDSSWKR